jgi:hypothetical protein
MLGGEEPITLESAEDVISFGLMTRRLDKFARAFNGEFRDDDLNFESTEDAHLDDMVYAAMSASNLNDKKDDTSGLKIGHVTVTPGENESE